MADNHIPVGFAMSLSQHEDALKYYGSLDKMQQEQIKNYIQNSTTGDEAKQRIENSVNGLSNNNLNFLN